MWAVEFPQQLKENKVNRIWLILQDKIIISIECTFVDKILCKPYKLLNFLASVDGGTISQWERLISDAHGIFAYSKKPV